MKRGIALTATLSAVAFVAPSAWACTIPLPPPQLPGESEKAYEARLVELSRKEDRERTQARQVEALWQAGLIFIARDTIWTPPHLPAPVHRPLARPVKRLVGRAVARPLGRTIPPPPAPRGRIDTSAPLYFNPVAWFRGQPSQAPFHVERIKTMCGLIGVGDTVHSQPGNLYVFFARKGPLSEKTLIDAIAVDKIDDPALAAFVAKHRGKPPAASR